MKKAIKYLAIGLAFGFAVGMLFSIPFRPGPEIIVKEKPCTLNEQIIDVFRIEQIVRSQMCVNNGWLPDRDAWSGELKGCIAPPEGF